MTAIAQTPIDPALTPARFWPALAATVQAWLARQAVPPRDAVLLLPFAELLVPAREALAALGGWQPRVETLRTLAAGLGPAPAVAAGAPSGDAAVDRLLAAELLLQRPGLAGWRRRDPLAFDQAVSELQQAAQWLARRAAACAPSQREAWLVRARERLAAVAAGPAAMRHSLARLALEWAAQAGPAAGDRLHATLPAAAWIVLQAGGEDPAATALLDSAAAAGRPCLRLLADAAGEDPLAALPACAPQLLYAADAEDEAQAAAAVVLQALARGAAPVALVAEDRLRVRRIRALLDRAGVLIADESGWALDTTRAAARLMALLRAARPGTGPDAWLDALKADSEPGRGAGWVDALERRWRRSGAPTATETEALSRAGPEAVSEPRADDPGEAAVGPDTVDRQWQAWRARWQAFAEPARRPLAAWLAALRELLDGSAQATFWREDPAARALRQALRLDQGAVRADVDAAALALDEFTAWVDTTLAQGSFIPAVARDAAQVVITPLARAMLRPFGAIVLPGADERGLGQPSAGPALLDDAGLRELGIDDRAARALRQARCFAQLLRHPDLTLLRRRADGDVLLGPSPWLSRLQLARREHGLPPLPEAAAAPAWRTLDAAPVSPPAPTAAAALPASLSASALEALRACPYRFYARSVLRLGEAEELEADPGKRDYGSLLHAVLQRWHDAGEAAAPREAALRRWLALADAVAAETGLDAPAMLPFRAGLPGFAERYLDWQAGREAAGWRYAGGELDRRCTPPGLGGLQLHGRIDRLDRNEADGAWQLLDYKTGSLAGLKAKVRAPLEDTQLAFYAAQVLAGDDPPPGALQAAYVALDDRGGVVELAHADVACSARALLDGLADEWQRLRDGAPLRPLGEAEACGFCEARGLCRRDHWAEPLRLPAGDV